ncbi:hypothetical protein QBC32DRAFT_204749 [Pseudoneurospora amorphoporcata]|uniref:Uncharacterized protein n=1 Tax=Pseudoneurospora amorphoporcata TaxID=241081 RepID=A0AAN6P3B2_9PEZI|nr:hypothetical protein QBC32DRAFT_204749 [Pseudoneurospora amorphoporcata]
MSSCVGPDFDVLPRQSTSPKKCSHRVCVPMPLSRRVHDRASAARRGICPIGDEKGQLTQRFLGWKVAGQAGNLNKWKWKGKMTSRLSHHTHQTQATMSSSYASEDPSLLDEPVSGQAAQSFISVSTSQEEDALLLARDDESEPSQDAFNNPSLPSHIPSATLTFRPDEPLRDPVFYNSFLGLSELNSAAARRARMLEQFGPSAFNTPSFSDSLPMPSSSFDSEGTVTTLNPPTEVDNKLRFRSFIDRINRRQWSFLSDEVQSTITYNKEDISLYHLVETFKEEFSRRSNTQMDIVILIAGTPEEGEPVAARLKVKDSIVQRPYTASSQRRQTEYTRHMFVYFTDEKISEIQDIVDGAEKRRQSPNVVPVPNFRPPPPPSSIDLRQFYEDYIACINGKTMQQDLHQFCQGTVVWNGAEMALNDYGQLMENAFDAISGLQFVPRTVLIDEAKQQVAVRIEFAGLPIKPFGGGMPNGRRVHFAEHAFYWLEQGKISHVLTVVDWEDFRSQLDF